MIYQRPKLNIFAEAAKAGEAVSFPDWARGWGITIEQTNSKPPMQWMNDALKQLNTHSLYLLQNGGYEWDKALEYPVGAKAQINNLIYIANVKNTNINPEGNVATWSIYGLHQSDISQRLDGTSAVKAASEWALGSVNNKAVINAESIGLLRMQLNSVSGVANNAIPKTWISHTVAEDSASMVPSSAALNYVRKMIPGVDQSYKNVLSSRSLGTLYTNGSDRPIIVTVSVIVNTAGQSVSASVDGVQVCSTSVSTQNNATASVRVPLAFLVPPKSQYTVSAGVAQSNVITWSELS